MLRYSSALRCSACEQRAILERAVAAKLVAESHRALVLFDCPVGNGVHVKNPAFEKSPTA
ncbi:hypothetical protein [Saccharopolyspora flava]|uniref:Uncharacterized protein n=1 Tax=Saccharopolyspora flava TaxID=95161 RepID=A0A1I6UPA2_9PSEU|nr:hypothetical protein [Saccharopolyspora flava]SFT03258.1 hypothetical protein SAMN05660874_05117 [Saccharopolyspora flava]